MGTTTCICGEEFESYRTKRYCSSKCRYKARNRQKMEVKLRHKFSGLRYSDKSPLGKDALSRFLLKLRMSGQIHK